MCLGLALDFNNGIILQWMSWQGNWGTRPHTLTLSITYKNNFCPCLIDNTYSAEHGHQGVQSKTLSDITVAHSNHTRTIYFYGIGF